MQMCVHPGVGETVPRGTSGAKWIEYMTSDHRVAGSSPAGCKAATRADLQAIEAARKLVTERVTYHSLTTFEVYPVPRARVGIFPRSLWKRLTKLTQPGFIFGEILLNTARINSPPPEP
jgi:hypothetical protein